MLLFVPDTAAAAAASEPSTVVILLIVLAAFTVVFPLLWFGIVGLLGAMGWKGLAGRFPVERWPERGEGEALSLQTGRVGAVSYRNTLNVVVTDDGLYLRPMKLFAFNHPPLFVPWPAVERVESTFLGAAKLYLAGGGSLVLYWRLGKLVRERLGVSA